LLAKQKAKYQNTKLYLNQVGGGCGLEQSLCLKKKTENAKKKRVRGREKDGEGGCGGGFFLNKLC
jgi:hypothetical protein